MGLQINSLNLFIRTSKLQNIFFEIDRLWALIFSLFLPGQYIYRVCRLTPKIQWKVRKNRIKISNKRKLFYGMKQWNYSKCSVKGNLIFMYYLYFPSPSLIFFFSPDLSPRFHFAKMLIYESYWCLVIKIKKVELFRGNEGRRKEQLLNGITLNINRTGWTKRRIQFYLI